MCVCGRYRLCQKFLISQSLSHKLEVDMEGFSHLAAHSYGLKPIWCECSISAAGIQLNHLLKWPFYFWMVQKYFLSFLSILSKPSSWHLGLCNKLPQNIDIIHYPVSLLCLI